MVDEIFHRTNYLGNAGLVIGAEERVAVGHYEVLTHVVEQLGKLCGAEHYAFLGVEHYVAAVVGFHNARIHILARHVGRCVEVSYESYHRYLA